MFLKPLSPQHRARRHGRSAESERGSALVLVIILLVVLTAMGLLVAAIAMHAIGATTATRAGMQSQAAADAGVDYAASKIGITHDCDATYHSASSSVDFDVEAYYSLTDDGDDWVACPISEAKAKRIKLVSTGEAATEGMVGRSNGDEAKVEAIFAYHAPDPIPASGSALYSYTAPVFNNSQVSSGAAEPANVDVYEGDFDCTSGVSRIAGTVLIADGNGILDNGCVVDGDLWASKAVNLNKGTVQGNVKSAGTGNANTFATDGSVTVDGFIALAGRTNHTGGCTSDNLVCQVDALTSKVAGGSVTLNDETIKAPTVTSWIDYGFDSYDGEHRWTDAGFTIVDWKKSEWGAVTSDDICVIDGGTISPKFTDDVLNAESPIVVDATDCKGGLRFVASGSLDWKMRTDIAFMVSGAVDLANLKISSSDEAEEHHLWFITPDEDPHGTPTCADESTDHTNTNGDVAINEPISALIYTPCDLRNTSNSWRGQLYGGNVTLDTDSTINFVPVGLAGVDLGTGEQGGTKGILGSQLTNRNIAG